MRRFLSWIVMVVSQYIVLIVISLALVLIRLILGEINRLSSLIYWVVLLLGGATILGILAGIAGYGSFLSVKLSQLVWKSKKGTRYIVFGIICIVLYALTTILTLLKVLTGTDVVLQILFLLTSIIYLIIGINVAREDGGPPTKREILQAKIDRIDAIEAQKENKSV